MEEVKKRGPGRPPKAEKAQIVEQEGRKTNIQVVDNVDSLADNTRKQLSGPEELGSTSNRLFPDYENRTVEKEQIIAPDEDNVFHQQVESQEPVQPPEEQPANDVWDSEALKGKKFKAIIGGQEQVIPAEELIKGYQTPQYISSKYDKLVEERRALAEERQRLEELRTRTPAPYQEQSYQPDDEYVQKLERRLARMEANFGQIAQSLQPTIYETNQKRLAEELKREGFDDFIDYLPKMKQHIAELQDDRMVRFYDTYEGGKALYQQLKNKELMEKLRANEANKPPQQPQRPPIVRIDAGSSQGVPIDESGAKIKAAFDRARQTRDPDDWNTYLSLKGVI